MRRLLQAGSSNSTHMYQERLGAIGALLDARGCHAMVIVEGEGGMLVRASRKGSRHPEIIEVVDGEALPVEPLDPRVDVRRRLFPGGYAPFLEVLGQRLDRRQATSISIVEGTDFVTVSGFAPLPLGADESIFEALDLLLLPEDILQLLKRGLEPDTPPAQPVAPPAPVEARRKSSEHHNPLSAAIAPFSRVLGLARPQTFRMRG